ncbi:MAG: ribonuclease H family protein [Arthrospira platensis]
MAQRHEQSPPAEQAQAAPELPVEILPLEPDMLSERRAVKKARRRQRRLERPAYVNTDASWRDGKAGVAYESGRLGNRTAFVACAGSTEAEYMALLMAMLDAERCLSGPIAFRSDCEAVVNLKGDTTPQIVALREQVRLVLKRHPNWSVTLVNRSRNMPAHGLATRPFRQREDE